MYLILEIKNFFPDYRSKLNFLLASFFLCCYKTPWLYLKKIIFTQNQNLTLPPLPMQLLYRGKK